MANNPYNPYTAVNSIYNLKGTWADANKANDTNKKNKAAADAQTYYTELRDNGYGDVADALAATDYAGAKAINDKWATTGKNKTRDYFYSLGASKGMSKTDMDKLISWDNTTGEVSFAGKKIGKPDVVIDGTSYWGDTTPLDNAWNDYLQRSEPVMDDATLMAKGNTGVHNKIQDLWGLQTDDHKALTDKWGKEYEDLKNTNPFTTDEAKAILAKYDLAGLQGRDNAVASGSASNGGNIDSYSAANAMRQQASLINQGQMTVLSAYNDKLANARAILEGLGAYQKDSYTGMQNTIGMEQNEAQRLFENDQTAKNNDVDNKVKMAAVTGYNPIEWVLKNDPLYSQYVDANGKLTDEAMAIDFQAEINNAKARGDSATADKLAVLRGMKIAQDYKNYGQYSKEGDIKYLPGVGRTADFTLAQDQMKNALDIAKEGYTSNENIANVNAETTKYGYDKDIEKAGITAQNNIDQITTAAKYNTTTTGKPNGMTLAQATAALKNGELSDAALAVYNANHGTSYTTENPPPIYKPATTEGDTPGWADGGSGDTPETDYEAKLNTVYNDSSKTVKDYIRNKLKPLITENSVTEEELRNHLINNSKDYDLEVKDIKAICEALDVDSIWVDNYKNSGLFGWGSGVKEK